MKLKPVVAGLVLGLLSISAVSAADYKADLAHSSIAFKLKHMFTYAKGDFKDFSGSFSFDEKTGALSNIDFKIKVSSIDTNNGKRDEHLKSPDFFEVEKYPEITFKAEKIKKIGKTKYSIQGPLTMKGVTKPVTFVAEYLGSAKNPWGMETSSFTASTKINRKDFNLIWNKTLDNGGLLVGETVDISVEIEAGPVQNK